MKITVFTSNQPRHVALLETLSKVADEVFAVQECNTVHPGVIEDFFRQSPVLRQYFGHVLDAERRVFGGPRFMPAGVRSLAVRMGDLNRIPVADLRHALCSDVFVVFGASYIRGALCAELVKRPTVNLHMGVSPYYRGSSTNFWAQYDRRPDLVGATLHQLTAGLDSGPIYCHALPPVGAFPPFELGMQAVNAAHLALVDLLTTGKLERIVPVPQDSARQMRYTRNVDFGDDVAASFLQRLPSPRAIEAQLEQRDDTMFINPFVPAVPALRSSMAAPVRRLAQAVQLASSSV